MKLVRKVKIVFAISHAIINQSLRKFGGRMVVVSKEYGMSLIFLSKKSATLFRIALSMLVVNP